MYSEIKRRVADSYRKNNEDILALLRRDYPKFVFHEIDAVPSGTIPVFAFHSVRPELFEFQLRYLAENRYKTLNSEQAYDAISGRKKAESNSIVLTFDDGWASLWSVAFPILKRYELNAIAFVIPARVTGQSLRRLSMDDVWAGRSTVREVVSQESESPFCTWSELREMYDSGFVDIQSHSNHHNTVFVDDSIVDFVNPTFSPTFLSGSYSPVVRRNGNDAFESALEYGYPVYSSRPALASARRYVEDEDLCHHCVEYVRRNGGSAFFENRRWRRVLRKLVHEFENRYGVYGRLQDSEERFAEMLADLGQSKEIIEQNLKSSVRHLCYPWFTGSTLAVKASRKAGYLSSYWGLLGRRTTNRTGDNPYYMARMNDEYVSCLPGHQRTSLRKVLLSKVRRILMT